MTPRNRNEIASNKAFHRTSHKVRRPVNADVGHMKSITGMRVLLIMAVLVLAMGCHRGAITSHSATARDLENELFPLDPTQLFARGITEVNDGVDQPYWMLANFMDSDTISEGFIRELFKQNDIAWQGSGNMGMWAVYVAKTDFHARKCCLWSVSLRMDSTSESGIRGKAKKKWMNGCPTRGSRLSAPKRASSLNPDVG